MISTRMLSATRGTASPIINHSRSLLPIFSLFFQDRMMRPLYPCVDLQSTPCLQQLSLPRLPRSHSHLLPPVLVRAVAVRTVRTAVRRPRPRREDGISLGLMAK